MSIHHFITASLTNLRVSVLCWPGVHGLFCRDDVWMADVDVSGGLVAGPRRRRSAVERRRIVEETLEAGASVATGGVEVWREREPGVSVEASASGRQARRGC